MGNVWFTSDLHLGHERIVELSKRPFGSIDHHDNTICENWRHYIGEDDLVYVLGDVSVEGSYKHALGLIASLPGRKRLVTGNHDRAWVGKSDAFRFMPAYLEVFEAVTPWARAKVDGVKVVLSHFPYQGDRGGDRYAQYRLPFSTTPILHGHTHSTERRTLAPGPGYTYGWLEKVIQVHVGVDAWDYAPVSQQQAARLVSEDPPARHEAEHQQEAGR